jgi:hypothetical protein
MKEGECNTDDKCAQEEIPKEDDFACSMALSFLA